MTKDQILAGVAAQHAATEKFIDDNWPVAPPIPTPPAIDPADILGRADADIPFAQQSGYTAQVIGTYTDAAKIPETGIHGSPMPGGSTLRLGKTPDPLALGRQALCFALMPTDPKTSGSWRTELSFGQMVDMGKLYWTAFSALVQDWGTDPTEGLFGVQLHSGNNNIDLSPTFSVNYQPKAPRNYHVESRYCTATPPTRAKTTTSKAAEFPIKFGRWVDFVFQVKNDLTGAGILNGWADGVPIVTYKGNLGYSTPGYKDYFKFGIYNWASFTTQRQILLRKVVIVKDPAGKYTADILRAYLIR